MIPYNTFPNDTSWPAVGNWPDFTYDDEGYQPRCGHCGRFIADGFDAFDRHINDECPVGGTFVNGKLRRGSVLMSALPGDEGDSQ